MGAPRRRRVPLVPFYDERGVRVFEDDEFSMMPRGDMARELAEDVFDADVEEEP